MSKIIVLDTGVLGLAVHGNAARRAPLARWMSHHITTANFFRVPEVADYELRRELILNNFAQSIDYLDQLKLAVGYIPLSTHMMVKAAELWAQARKADQQTANNQALDGDVILCAQTLALQRAHPADSIVIATTNVGHLARFVPADLWQNIIP